MKLIFQLCHLHLHRDWARVKESEKSVPRILENVRVRHCCKPVLLHHHPSCLMCPCVGSLGRWQGGNKKCHEGQPVCALVGQAKPKASMRWEACPCQVCYASVSVAMETPEGISSEVWLHCLQPSKKVFWLLDWVIIGITKRSCAVNRVSCERTFIPLDTIS